MSVELEKAKEILSECRSHADEKWMVEHLALVDEHLDRAITDLQVPAKPEIQKIIDALTNGVGEKPYCRREDGVMKVFVADDCLFCTVPAFESGSGDGYEEEIANAICESGLLIKYLAAENERLKGHLAEYGRHKTGCLYLKEIGGGFVGDCTCGFSKVLR